MAADLLQSVKLMHDSMHLQQIIATGCFPYMNVIFISGNMEQKIYRNKLQRLLTREGRLK
jgi:hypothetical protein